MQIREMTLKELDSIYKLIQQLYKDLAYKEFEDLMYDMRHIEYKMLGVFDDDILVCYAGVSIQTNLYDKRHLFVFDFIADTLHVKEEYRRQQYENGMLHYLSSYAKSGMCEKVVFAQHL